MTDFLGRLFDRSSCLEASSGALLETLCTGRWRISQGQCSSTIQYSTVNKTVVHGGTRRHYPLVPPTPTGPPGYYYWYLFSVFFGNSLFSSRVSLEVLVNLCYFFSCYLWFSVLSTDFLMIFRSRLEFNVTLEVRLEVQRCTPRESRKKVVSRDKS